MAGSFVLFGSVYINYAVLQIERKKKLFIKLDHVLRYFYYCNKNGK